MVNVEKLYQQSRLVPIMKTSSESKTGWICVGFKRRKRSRRAGQEFYLKTPRPCSAPGTKFEIYPVGGGDHVHNEASPSLG